MSTAFKTSSTTAKANGSTTATDEPRAPVPSLRERMIEDMQARMLKPGTQRGYIRGCKRFAAFLRRPLDTATPEDVRRFQHHLVDVRTSICTRNQTMVGVGFLFKVTLRRPDLVAEIYHLREPLRVPLVMSPDEVRVLIAAAATLKARVMLSLCYGCGLRAGEVVRLRVCDIDSAQMIIRIVQAKGRKDRHVMLSPDTLALLRQYWPTRPARYDTGVAPDQRWLFPGHDPEGPISTRQLNRVFHEAATAAGIKKGVTLHTLRHSFATHLLERGLNIRLIQALLGHEKLDTTAHYTRVATGTIAAIESPLDDLAKAERRAKRKAKRKPDGPPAD
jgi:site-specific recombinase XerD